MQNFRFVEGLGSQGSIKSPTGVTATADMSEDGAVILNWIYPRQMTSNSQIPNYSITAFDGCLKKIISHTATEQLVNNTGGGNFYELGGRTPRKRITGLRPGTSYTFTIIASEDSRGGLSSFDPSPPSAPSNPVTTRGTAPPAITIPGAPTELRAIKNSDVSIRIVWVAPDVCENSPITNYTITASPGGLTKSVTDIRAGVMMSNIQGDPRNLIGTFEKQGRDTVTIFTGLTPGRYTFTITATNSFGTGPASRASEAVMIGDTSSAAVNTNANPVRQSPEAIAAMIAGFKAAIKEAEEKPLAPAGTAPGVPTNVIAQLVPLSQRNPNIKGVEHIGISWTAPSSPSPIIGYTIIPSTPLASIDMGLGFISGATKQTIVASPDGGRLPTNVTLYGLPGTSYTFTVTAINASGKGEPSSPSAPIITSGQANNSSGGLPGMNTQTINTSPGVSTIAQQTADAALAAQQATASLAAQQASASLAAQQAATAAAAAAAQPAVDQDRQRMEAEAIQRMEAEYQQRMKNDAIQIAADAAAAAADPAQPVVDQDRQRMEAEAIQRMEAEYQQRMKNDAIQIAADAAAAAATTASTSTSTSAPESTSTSIFGPAPESAPAPAPESTSSSIFGPAPVSTSTSIFGPAPVSTSTSIFGPAPESTSTSIFGPAPASTSTSIFGPAPASTSTSIFGPAPASAQEANVLATTQPRVISQPSVKIGGLAEEQAAAELAIREAQLASQAAIYAQRQAPPLESQQRGNSSSGLPGMNTQIINTSPAPSPRISSGGLPGMNIQLSSTAQRTRQTAQRAQQRAQQRAAADYAAEYAAKRGEDLDCEELVCEEVEGFTSKKPLHLYESLPEYQNFTNNPVMPILLTGVLFGAIFMALFSSYSPINLRKLKIY